VALVELRDGVLRFTLCSPSYKTRLGHTPGALQLEVTKLSALFGEQGAEEVGRTLAAAFDGSGKDTWEQPLLHAADHSEVWFEHRTNLDQSDPNVALLVSRDITDRRERQRLEMDVATRSQAELAAYVFHELRNDQNAIEGSLEARPDPLLSTHAPGQHAACAATGPPG